MVGWKGYGQEQHFWDLAEDIKDPSLILDFHHEHPCQTASRPGANVWWLLVPPVRWGIGMSTQDISPPCQQSSPSDLILVP